MNHDDTRFDAAMRAVHLQALEHVSPQVRRRLRAARAAPGHAPRALGWGLASGGAALFGLVVALQLHAPPEHPRASAPAVATTTAAPAPDVPIALAALEQNPDFYLWLASNDNAMPTPSPE